MFFGVGKTIFLLGFFAVVASEVVYKWPKSMIFPDIKRTNWRATSFSVLDKKIFLTLIDIAKPISGNGIVAEFNTTSSQQPDLKIFPFRNFYKLNDPERGRVTTPISIRVDQCKRLWLLDSAVQNISGIQMKTNPGIHIFNTNNGQLLRSFNIPQNQWSNSSFFVNFIVDVENTEDDCEDSFAYFADFNRFQLLIYDFHRNKSALKSHPFFSPDPLIHTPNEVLFNTKHQDINGIYGLALVKSLSAKKNDTLYFHSLAGIHEFSIDKEILKSQNNLKYDDVKYFMNKGKKTEAGVSVFEPVNRTLFFAEINTQRLGGFLFTKYFGNLYYRYSFNIRQGKIVDLTVLQSKMWILVDSPSEIIIHNINIADLQSSYVLTQKTDILPPAPKSSSNKNLFFFSIPHLMIIHFLMFSL